MVSKGHSAVPANSTIFLSKFAFSFQPLADYEKLSSAAYDPKRHIIGLVDIKVTVPDFEMGQAVHILLFDDEARSYPGPSGEWDSLPCDQRIQHARRDMVLSRSQRRFSIPIREKLRPRWWYIALADCSGKGLKSVEYEIHTKNSLYGWAEEFSSDKRLALPAFCLLSITFLFLAAAQIRANMVLAARRGADDAGSKAAHPFARILAAGILLELTGCALEALQNLIYASNGSGSPTMHAGALLLSVCSNFILASLLLLVSEGKCVSYRMVVADAHRMCKVLAPFLTSCLILELWGDFATSRTYSTDYAYTTRCGWIIIMVDLGLLAKYVQNLKATLSLDGGQADRKFYRTWGTAYGAWFLALPFSALLSQAVLAPYVWYIVSLCITKLVTVAVYGALVFALWPENTRSHFKMLHASPEEMMEICPSPPSREGRQTASFPAEENVLPHLLPRKGIGSLASWTCSKLPQR
eukprot:TRINITY_DN15964_c0_g2_i1.p1 TRINITY_DN15964_c0_g2~~TRINITY_DN15964_c0_g2_i1.p1  ORF type:complete len:495 (-),score=68.65 TRINITY_DN15964_c0_g2_i1:131-1534(-)